ncbi:uncharacterized protein EI90DRAFT_3119881 [Cantharellus anzutake]|uniref:uncharacterized protein n=1 Tax=Cantharellus anzutake TaxID=1750568 RepID=UPI001905CC13|nr:uncharacterized protein EI90DRAFT_3119881 [Cantharellus anzutake]KAF8336632.1 hypothetical protein EI90DRAFT_3119881 [Cantharellus anzutake]
MKQLRKLPNPILLSPTPPPIPLPTTIPQNLNSNEQRKDAYEQCLSLEGREAWGLQVRDLEKDYLENIMNRLSPDVVARVLGRGLLTAPNEQGFDELTRPTPQLSRQSFEQTKQRGSPLLQQPSIPDTKLKQLILRRDNYRCIFTDLLDSSAEGEGSPMEEDISTESDLVEMTEDNMRVQEIKPTLGITFVSHIVLGPAAVLIERFGGIPSQILGDESLNGPLNAFTASATPHQLWMVPAKDKEALSGRQIARTIWDQKSRYAKSEDEEPPHLPDSRLIALHAACAMILHLSGAIEYVWDFLFREPKPISLMTEPNAAQELTQALEKLQYISAVA